MPSPTPEGSSLLPPSILCFFWGASAADGKDAVLVLVDLNDSRDFQVGTTWSNRGSARFLSRAWGSVLPGICRSLRRGACRSDQHSLHGTEERVGRKLPLCQNLGGRQSEVQVPNRGRLAQPVNRVFNSIALEGQYRLLTSHLVNVGLLLLKKGWRM